MSIPGQANVPYCPSHKKYYKDCLQQEAVYRQWLVDRGVTLPDWLEPLSPVSTTANTGTITSTEPSDAPHDLTLSTPGTPSMTTLPATPSPKPEGQEDANAGSPEADPSSTAWLAAVATKHAADEPTTPPAKRVCTDSELHLWPLVAVLLRVFEPLIQLQAIVAGVGSSSSNQQQAFDAAAAALLQQAWNACVADLQQSVMEAITHCAADITSHGSSRSCRTASELFAAAYNISTAVPTAAAAVASVTALCSSSMQGMQAGQGSITSLQAWNILQAFSTFHDKVEAAAATSDTPNRAAAAGGWLSSFQNAVAVLLAALLGDDNDAQFSKSELMLQLFAVQKQLPADQQHVQRLMGQLMERLVAHCTAV